MDNRFLSYQSDFPAECVYSPQVDIINLIDFLPFCQKQTTYGTVLLSKKVSTPKGKNLYVLALCV